MRHGLGAAAATLRAARRQRRGRSVPSACSLGARSAGRRSRTWHLPCAPRLRREAGRKCLGCRWAGISWEGALEEQEKQRTYRGFGTSHVLRRSRCPPRRGHGEAAPGRVVSGVCGVSEGQIPALPDSRLCPQGPLMPPTLDMRVQHRQGPTPLCLSCLVVEGTPRDAGCFSARRSSQAARPVALECGVLPLVLLSFPKLGAPGLPS